MKTKFIWASLAGLLAWTVWGAEAVVVNLDDVVVPASAVTARLDSLTVSEAAITVSAESEKIRRDLIDQVRHGKTEAERLAALAHVWNQDDVLYLFFKPGEDGNANVRIAAINRLMDVSVLKVLAEKVTIPDIAKAISNRLDQVYLNTNDRLAHANDKEVTRKYIQRIKERK